MVAVMRNGAIQQMATPQEIYDRPANLFVAGFIGSPSMNLIAGVLEEEDGLAVIRVTGRGSGEARLTLGPLQPAHHPFLSGNVLLGVRPEAITLDPGSAAADGTSFEARIDVIEPTGADNLAFFTLGGNEVIARLPPGRSLAGENVKLRIDPSRVLLFDPASEQRIACK